MHYAKFTLAGVSQNNRLAINPAQVVAVTAFGESTTIRLSAPISDGHLAYTVVGSLDAVVAQLESALHAG